MFTTGRLTVLLVVVWLTTSCGSPPTGITTIAVPNPCTVKAGTTLSLAVNGFTPDNAQFNWYAPKGVFLQQGERRALYSPEPSTTQENVLISVDITSSSGTQTLNISCLIEPSIPPGSPTPTVTVSPPAGGTPTPTGTPPTATPQLIPPPIYGATAAEALQRIRAAGQIVFVVRYDAPPYGNDLRLRALLSADPGQLTSQCNPSAANNDFQPTGYDIEIIKEFVQRWIGPGALVKVRCVPVGDRVEVLRTGVVRIGVFSFSKLPERCAPDENPFAALDLNSNLVLCSIRYMVDGQGVMVRANSGIAQLCDLDGKRVAIVEGTSAAKLFVQGMQAFCGATPIPVLVETRAEALSRLEKLAGDPDAVDGYATNVEILKALAAERPDLFVVPPGEFGDEEFGVGVTPGETGLLELVNLTIQAMKADGTLDALIGTTFNCRMRGLDVDVTASAVELATVQRIGPAPGNPSCPEPPPLDPTQERIYQVQSGETLAGIARVVYEGDADLWPCIANKNNIPDPKLLPIGPLTIPPKESCQ